MDKRNRRPSKVERQRQAIARVESVRSAIADVLDPAESIRRHVAELESAQRQTLLAAIEALERTAEPERDLWIHPFMLAPQGIPRPVADATPEAPDPRTRQTNLTAAMDTMRRALTRTLKRRPSPREVWNAFRVTRDPTGAVVKVDDEFIWWRDQDGAKHSTKFKTFANSYSKLRAPV